MLETVRQARGTEKRDAGGNTLLGIVAAEVPLDPWVWDSLVDGYALQGDPFVREHFRQDLSFEGSAGKQKRQRGGLPGANVFCKLFCISTGLSFCMQANSIH